MIETLWQCPVAQFSVRELAPPALPLVLCTPVLPPGFRVLEFGGRLLLVGVVLALLLLVGWLE